MNNTFGMFLIEEFATWQNASKGAVRKNVNMLPLLLDGNEEDVGATPLSSTGCMLGDSSNTAGSPLSFPLMDYMHNNNQM